MICDKMKSVFAKIFGYDEDSKPDPVNLKPIDPDTALQHHNLETLYYIHYQASLHFYYI